MRFRKGPFWIRFGLPEQSDSFLGILSGKYLFFSEDQEKLLTLCRHEIENHGFKVAKVATNPRSGEYACCLYWTDDKRKHELGERYKNTEGIKYRYWKSNADTRAGKYSEQFLKGVPND